MHNGQFDTLDNIIGFYRGVSDQARAGMLRNGAAQLQGIALTAGDVAPLVAFLKSLNEDYQKGRSTIRHRAAGAPHTGIEVGVVPSHFTGGGPLFLLRPPAHNFYGLIG